MTKSLISLNPFVANGKDKKLKYCSNCGSPATTEALFDVGNGITSIEKYCDPCSKEFARG